MPRYCCLFAHDHPSTPDTDWEPDHGHFDGWAEWFERLPLLFLYLIGDAEHLPRIVPLAIYEDNEPPAGLMAPMAEVRQRWDALERQMQPRLPDLSGAALALWKQVQQTISASARHWLILDAAMLSGASVGEPELGAWLEQTRQRCAQWSLKNDDWPAALQPLLDAFDVTGGWWSPAVIARRYDVDEEYEPAFPGEVLQRCDPEDFCSWEDEAGAYLVPVREQGGKKKKERQALVTGYGRWLVHPDEEAERIDVKDGWICVHRPAGASSAANETGDPSEGPCPSGLKDLNGAWVIPVSAAYGNIWVLTATLMQCRASAGPHETWQIRSLPDCRLLFDDLQDVQQDDEDKLVRVTHADGSLSLLDAAGKALFNGPYEYVAEISKKTGLAIVNDGKGRGVIHTTSGKLIIPCEYEEIESGVQDKPPRVFPGGKILALGKNRRPYVYSTKGKLLASPPITIHGGRFKDKDRWLACDGDGPDAQVLWFSMTDLSIEHLGVTVQAYFKPLTDRFKSLIEYAKTEPRDITREELLAAEDTDWMQSICRIVRLGNDADAHALYEQWLERVKEPHREEDDEENDDEEDGANLLTIRGDENALTVYWRLMPGDAYEIAEMDWKDTDALAAINRISSVPGTQGWHWDRDEDGESMQDGFDSLAAHLERQELALVSLDTGGDSYCLMATRLEDGDAFVALLEQARVKAVRWSAS
jgi:hypothetical protein